MGCGGSVLRVGSAGMGLMAAGDGMQDRRATVLRAGPRSGAGGSGGGVMVAMALHGRRKTKRLAYGRLGMLAMALHGRRKTK